MAIRVPEVVLNTSCSGEPEDGINMPLIGLGTGGGGSDATKAAVIEAIKVGYRHFDTAFLYGNEKAVGDAVAEALRDGLIKSRDELFITSKLWCTSAERDLVVPAIRASLEKLQMDYLDLYLIHFPLKLIPEAHNPPYPDEHIQPSNLCGKEWKNVSALASPNPSASAISPFVGSNRPFRLPPSLLLSTRWR